MFSGVILEHSGKRRKGGVVPTSRGKRGGWAATRPSFANRTNSAPGLKGAYRARFRHDVGGEARQRESCGMLEALRGGAAYFMPSSITLSKRRPPNLLKCRLANSTTAGPIST